MQAFVGRTRELSELAALIPTSTTDTGAIRMIVGPAGIGKTRIAAEVARQAAELGVVVAWGRCWDEGTSRPYWPWVQVVRALRQGERGTDLAELVLGTSDTADRLELFDATCQVIEQAAADAPLVIVFDDLHHADAASTGLLRYIDDRIASLPVLILGTHRSPATGRHDVAAQLDALGQRVGTLGLPGLGIGEITDLIPHELSARRVHAATGGNPLFVHEVARLLPDDEAFDGSLRDVMRRRLEAVDPAIADLLGVMAVLGSEVTRDAVVAVAAIGRGSVDAILADAMAADLVVDDGDGPLIAHTLIAEAAFERLGESRLQELHAASAAFVSGIAGSETELAAHLLAAGPEHRTAGIDAARAAAVLASGTMAYEDAADMLGRAITALLLDDEHDDRTHLELLLGLGATGRNANRLADSDRAFDEAWELAARLGDHEALARAALRSGMQYYFSGDLSDVEAERSQIALAAQPPGPSPLRARLLANLALKLVVTDPVGSRRAYVEAKMIADTLDDPATLGFILLAGQISALGPSTLASRVDTARQMIAIAHTTGESGLLVQGRFLLMGALLERGDLRSLDHELAVQLKVLDTLGDVRSMQHSMWFRCMRALLDGRVAEGEELAHACFELSIELEDPDGIGVFGGQLGIVRWIAGRLIEMEPLYLERRTAEPNEPLWSAVVAYVWARHGRLDAARGALAALPPLDEVIEGQYWLLTMVSHGEAAVIVNDVAGMEAVREMLLPYADRIVPIGMGAALWGSVARLLGLIARALGRHDEGVHFLRRGVDVTSRVGARPWLVEAQLDLVEALGDGEHADAEEVGQILHEALSTAEQLSLTAFIARAVELRDRLGVALPAGDIAPAAPERMPSIAVLGGLEVRSADGELAAWSSRKARQLLMILVARRGVPIHREQLVEMLWPDDSSGRTSNRLDVAVSTVRRALDPGRVCASDELIESRGGSVRLRHATVRVDLEEFMHAATGALGTAAGRSISEILALANSYRGDAFPEEPYADWAEPTRSTAVAAATQLYRVVAGRAVAVGDHLVAIEAYRRLIELDRYDESAHLGLTDVLRRTGSRGVLDQALRAHAVVMAELGVEVRPTG